MFFLDADHGWALGNARCAARTRVCAVLLRTVDGASRWTRIGVPLGLVPVDDGDGPVNAGSCGTNGGIRGPCVDNVLFTDAAHGYVWSHNTFYWTTDGGAAWHNGHSRADSVVRIGSQVFRARPVADCSTCTYRVERASIGSSRWQDVTPGHRDRFGVRLLAAGDTLYATAGDGTGLYRSRDLGATWQPLRWPCGPSTSAARDGSFACVDERVRATARVVSVAGLLGTVYPLPANPADVYAIGTTRFVAFGHGWVYLTTDSARSWRKVARLAVSDDGYLSGTFAGSRGFLTSIYGTVSYTSSDGGGSWHRYEFG
jgi:photosystem II stability/assembly factor-like uncharacterized protein